MECSVTNITKQEAIFVVRESAILAPFTLLALPTSPDDGRDSDMSTSVEVVLATNSAKKKILEFFRG